jgi:hypothetical protein
MAQTAVDWFFDNLKNHEIQAEHFELYQQAKEMEKAQMITAMIYTFNQQNTLPYGMDYLHKRDEMQDDCENYYNETYNK